MVALGSPLTRLREASRVVAAHGKQLPQEDWRWKRRQWTGQMSTLLIEADLAKRNDAKGGKAPPYEEWTKDELYERAQELEIDGRSDMTKDELIDALRA